MEQEQPAGWYTDPHDVARRRYWDGGRWAALTQPPSLPERQAQPGPLGSPGNPIGAGSSALAAALSAMATTALAERRPVPAPESATTRGRFRPRWRSRRTESSPV